MYYIHFNACTDSYDKFWMVKSHLAALNHTPTLTASLALFNQLTEKSCRRPLTMANQCSEMKAQYKAEPEAISRVVAPTAAHPQPPVLSDHLKEGPTKVSNKVSHLNYNYLISGST